jgi:H2-forming N5,N10-methylenetetrahydromethanopterin dehydrogenase-like enzyme
MISESGPFDLLSSFDFRCLLRQFPQFSTIVSIMKNCGPSELIRRAHSMRLKPRQASLRSFLLVLSEVDDDENVRSSSIRSKFGD